MSLIYSMSLRLKNNFMFSPSFVKVILGWRMAANCKKKKHGSLLNKSSKVIEAFMKNRLSIGISSLKICLWRVKGRLKLVILDLQSLNERQRNNQTITLVLHHIWLPRFYIEINIHKAQTFGLLAFLISS